MGDATVETITAPSDATIGALRAELKRVTAERDWLRATLGIDDPRSA